MLHHFKGARRGSAENNQVHSTLQNTLCAKCMHCSNAYFLKIKNKTKQHAKIEFLGILSFKLVGEDPPVQCGAVHFYD